ARPGRPSGRPLRIVALGGGTGLPVVLRSLKRVVAEAGGTLTGIVTVTDDGGSSGRLRRAYDVLPMGDIRNCLVALSENEPLMSRLFQYRYRGRDGLGGHTVGNLILTALADSTRSYLRAIAPSLRRRYAADGAIPVEVDRAALRALGAIPVERNLLREDQDPKIRHHEGKLGRALLRLAVSRPARAAA